MAHMNQQKKSVIKVALDAVLKDKGIKYSLAVRDHMEIVCTLRAGPVDFMANYRQTNSDTSNRTDIDVNVYHPHLYFSGDVLSLAKDILAALNVGNHDNSDPQSDYFDVGWYVDLRIGSWNKPYVCTK